MMIIYSYHPETGIYLGPSMADESPLEPGVYLVPAHAIEIAPPDVGEKQVAVFADGEWTVRDIPDPDSEPEPEPDPLTRAEKLAALEAEYAPQRAELLQYISVAANILQDQAMLTELRAEWAQLEADYQTALEAINNA